MIVQFPTTDENQSCILAFGQVLAECEPDPPCPAQNQVDAPLPEGILANRRQANRFDTANITTTLSDRHLFRHVFLDRSRQLGQEKSAVLQIVLIKAADIDGGCRKMRIFPADDPRQPAQGTGRRDNRLIRKDPIGVIGNDL